MYYFYVLQSQRNRKLYFGYTSDLKKRYNEHNSGKVNYTSKYIPYKLLYYEAYLSESQARERERQIKHHGKAYKALKNRILKDED